MIEDLTAPLARLGVSYFRCTDRISALCLSPDGKLLVGGSSRGLLFFWEVSSGNLLHQLALDGMVNALCFSPDGARLMAATDAGLFCWELPSYQLLSTSPGCFVGVAISHTGGLVSVRTEDKQYHLARQGKTLLSVNKETYHCALSKDGSRFVSKQGSSILVFDTSDGSRLLELSWNEDITKEIEEMNFWAELERSTITRTPNVGALSLSPDNNLLAAADDEGRVFLWDLSTKERRAILSLCEPTNSRYSSIEIGSVVFSSDQKILLASFRDRFVSLWSTETGEKLGEKERASCRTAIFSQDSQYYFAAWDSFSVGRYKVSDGELSQEGTSPITVHQIAVSDDETLLAEIGYEFRPKVWSLHEKVAPRMFATPQGYLSTPDSMAFLPGKNILYANSFKGIYTWEDPQAPTLFTGLPHSGNEFVFSSDGALLVASFYHDPWDSSTHERAIYFFDTRTRARIGQLNTAFAETLCFSLDQKLLVVGHKTGEVSLWDLDKSSPLENKAPIVQLTAPLPEEAKENPNQRTNIVRISPNGKWVLLGWRYGIRVWNTETKELSYQGESLGKLGGCFAGYVTDDGQFQALILRYNPSQKWESTVELCSKEEARPLFRSCHPSFWFRFSAVFLPKAQQFAAVGPDGLVSFYPASF